MSTSINDATLAGIGVSAQVGDAIQAASEKIAIDEAPTVTLTLLDPQKKLLERVDLWNQPKEAPLLFVLGERSYGFVQLDKQPGRVLRATFESTVSLKLRAQQKYRKAYRKRITRLAFCQSLCREAGVKFHAPEASPPPPQFQPAKGAAAQAGGGFEAGAKVTVKRAPASTAQLALIETVLGVVFGMSLPDRVAIAVDMCVTEESVWNAKAGLNSHLPDAFDAAHPGLRFHITPSGHYGLYQQSPKSYPGVNWFDPVESTKAFLKDFLPLYHADPSGSLADMINRVQRPGKPDTIYSQWQDESTATVAAFTHPGASRTLLLNDKFEFSRGQPHQPETSWDALGRILSEIGWRRFVVGDTVWAASDEWLFATPSRATLVEDTGAVEDITWTLDAGKALDRASVAVDDSWVFSPGVVVSLDQEGPASGKWLLATWERDLLKPSGTLELIKPGKTIPEPVGDQTGKGYKPQAATGAAPTFQAAFLTQPIPQGPYNAHVIGGLHQTEGLPGYPAYDFGADAGSPVVAVEEGTIERYSGHDPMLGPTDGVHGPFGWSIYLKGKSGTDYYYTHLGSRLTALGAIVQAGKVIATVGDYAKWGGANHVHLGVHPGPSGHPTADDVKNATRAEKK